MDPPSQSLYPPSLTWNFDFGNLSDRLLYYVFPGGFCMCGRRLQQPGAVRRGQRTTIGTVQDKVLLAWRKATSCVKPSPAVSRAPSRMDKVRQQGTFRRWRERSRAVVEESTGMEKTKRHHSLLCSMFRLWTMYRQHQQSYKVMQETGHSMLRRAAPRW